MSEVTVLGATGGIGHALVAELTARGHEVTAVSRRSPRKPAGPSRWVSADLTDRGQAIAACRGADVVVMAAQVPYPQWARHLAAMVDHAAAGAVAAGARLVMVDNLYAYGAPAAPITEATPEAAATAKGTLRRDIGQRLLAAHREGRLAVTIGRFADYYGPGGTNSAPYVLGIAPALAGKRPRVLIDGDQPHTFAYLPDAARGFATLVERPDADGRIWLLPSAPPITQHALLDLVDAAVGRTAPRRTISRGMLAVAGMFDPMARELRELAEQWDRPYSVDASAFSAAFGLPVTPHERAVAETVAAFRGAEAVAA